MDINIKNMPIGYIPNMALSAGRRDDMKLTLAAVLQPHDIIATANFRTHGRTYK